MKLPSSPDAEKAFLSSIMQNSSVIDQCADLLKPALFHSSDNKHIFEAVLAIWKEGGMVDLITVTEKAKQVESHYVAEVYCTVPTWMAFESYLESMRSSMYARMAISGAEKIIQVAQDPLLSGELSETVQKALVSIAAESESSSKIESIGEAAMRRIDEYEEMAKNKGKLMGLTYGIRPLDEHTGGMRPGQLIILGGATKSGKTALALNIAQRTADAGNPVGIFSLEMSAGELIDRMVASVSGVDISIISKDPSRAILDKVSFGIRQISKLPIWIRDESSINPLQIMAATRRMVAAHGVKVVLFDYIQLATPNNNKDSRERQVADISRCLKLVAKELKITVVALTQLNAEGASRESRAIEHDADLVLALRHQEDGCFLDIRLGRNCSRASFPMEFRPQYLRFDSKE